MNSENLALVRGWADTRSALGRWQRRPLPVIVPWAVCSLVIAGSLLAATFVVALNSVPDPISYTFPGIDTPATGTDYAWILFRNGLVLLLHSLACVAGFMAGSSLPMVAEGYTGVWRWIHDKAGPLAIAFVIAATVFSLGTQALVLGGHASSLAGQLGLSKLELMIGIAPHAIPELFALFLPLAAWTLASRRGRWNELLAATFVTTAIAIPIVLGAAAVELWVSPKLLVALSG